MTRPFRSLPLLLSAALLMCTPAGAQTDAGTALASAPPSQSAPAPAPAPAPASASAPAADAYASLNPEHAAALRRMLDAMGLPSVLRYFMMHPPASAVPEQKQLLLHMGSHISDDELMRKVVPVYAKYVTRHAADVITTHLRSGAGRRQMVAALAKLGVSEGEKNPLYTPAEIAQLKRFEDTPEAHQVSDTAGKVKADLFTVSEQWGTQYYLHLLSESMRSLTEQFAAAAARKEGGPAVVITVPRTGLPMLDQMVQALAENGIEMDRADHQLKSDVDYYHLSRILAPERLASQEGLAQSRDALRQLDSSIETYLRALNQQQEKYRQRLIGISDSKSITAGFEKGLSHALDWQLRFADNQHGTLDAYRRMLAFAESRQGQISFENDKLTFKNDDDLQVYNTLREQIHQYAVEEKQLSIQRQQSMQALK